MRNLLFISVTERYINEKIIKDISKKNVIDHLYMIVSDTSEKDVFNRYGEVLLREDVAQGKYEEKMLTYRFPITDDLLHYMSLYDVEIMHQQRRFEIYHLFCVSPEWNDHYTIYMHNLFFWYNFLMEKRITHVFFSAIPHEGYDYMIYCLCKYLNISVLMINVSILQYRRYFLRDIYDINAVIGKEYQKIQQMYQNKGIEDVLLEGETAILFQNWASLEPEKMKPWYMRVDPFSRRLKTRLGETNLIRLWRGILGAEYLKYGRSGKFVFNSVLKIPLLMEVVFTAIKRMQLVVPVRRESIRLNNFYNSLAVSPNYSEKYIYFPLHYQPEATSNPMGGGMYADQILPISILSRSLPENIKIYVKSHPEQLALMRSKEYYLDLARIPKVKLIKLECSTYDLMKNATAVASLTGTALWECQFFGIPALVFGYSLKNLAPLSFPVRSVEECRHAVESILNMPPHNVLKQLKMYTKALHNTSFDVNELENVLPQQIIHFIVENAN